MKRVTIADRRARLGRRHHLARPVGSPERLASDLVGLHSSDPLTPFLAARARMDPFSVRDLEAPLYERRTLVRMLGMRRTLFIVPLDVAAVMQAGCARALAPAERRRLVKMLEDQGVAQDGEEWLGEVYGRTLEAVAVRGPATASELTEEVPELGQRFSFGEGKEWAGTVGVSTRVLFLLATDGHVVRGRPKGSWRSSQYRWAATADWLDGPLPEVDAEDARAELARRWLATYGPGTLTDLKWWSGWTVRATRQALAAVGAVEVELDNGPGLVLADDLDPVSAPEPWAALLPSLDPTVMGWKERHWYLGEHQATLFDRNGNAGPTVWWDGRIVGGWAQRADGEIAFAVLEDVGSEARTAIGAEAARLTEWLGADRITPRFRVPLERRLTA